MVDSGLLGQSLAGPAEVTAGRSNMSGGHEFVFLLMIPNAPGLVRGRYLTPKPVKHRSEPDPGEVSSEDLEENGALPTPVGE